MASKFVRSIREVEDIHKLSEIVTDENDLVSDLEGNVYVRTKNGFVEITQVFPKDFVDTVYSELDRFNEEIESLKVTNQVQYYKIETNEEKIKTLQTNVSDIQTNVSDIETKIENTVKKEEIEDTNTKLDNVISDVNNVNTSLENIIKTTGWVDITLSENITLYNDSEKPQYKINSFNGIDTVYIRGSVKGITERNTVIGNIPLPKTLDQKHPFTQVCSLKRNDKDELYTPINRWEVNINGDIQLVLLNIPTTDIKGTEWCPISTNFTI